MYFCAELLLIEYSILYLDDLVYKCSRFIISWDLSRS